MNQQNGLKFPFLGLRENGDPFEYFLENINAENAVVSISKWMTEHYTHLNLQEPVTLFVPNILTTIYHFREDTPGIVSSITKEEQEATYFYKISFEEQISIPESIDSPEKLAENLPKELNLTELLIKLVKDCLILKQGVAVYLKHLAPYFSRITDYSYKDYHELNNFIFDDVKKRINSNISNLSELYHSFKDIKKENEIPVILDLESFRVSIESEIDLDLFSVAFANLHSKEELVDLMKKYNNTDKIIFKYFYMHYLVYIKNLEKRLYSNYNQIVMIYLKSI